MHEECKWFDNSISILFDRLFVYQLSRKYVIFWQNQTTVFSLTILGRRLPSHFPASQYVDIYSNAHCSNVQMIIGRWLGSTYLHRTGVALSQLLEHSPFINLMQSSAGILPGYHLERNYVGLINPDRDMAATCWVFVDGVCFGPVNRISWIIVILCCWWAKKMAIYTTLRICTTYMLLFFVVMWYCITHFET